MKKVNLIVLALVAICLLAAPLTAGQGGNPPASTKESGATSGHGMTAVEQTKGNRASVPQELMALENKWTDEAKKGNADAVAPLLADDYVATFADSSVYNKSEFLARIKTAKWETNQIGDMKVAAHGNAAVVTGTWRGKGTENGKSVDAHERWTDTWVKMPNGKWQCVASHSSPILRIVAAPSDR